MQMVYRTLDTSIRQRTGFTRERQQHSQISLLRGTRTIEAYRWRSGERKKATGAHGLQIPTLSEPREVPSTDMFGSATPRIGRCWRGRNYRTRNVRRDPRPGVPVTRGQEMDFPSLLIGDSLVDATFQVSNNGQGISNQSRMVMLYSKSQYLEICDSTGKEEKPCVAMTNLLDTL